MDFSETLLKERFDAAVSDVSPDVFALVSEGTTVGRGLRRRRRVQQGLGAVVASAAAVAAIAYVGIGQGLFRSDDTGPAEGSVSQAPTEPSTPRSLAAAALEHLPADEVVGAATMGDSPDGTVFAVVGVRNGQGEAEVNLVATTQTQYWDRQPPCKASSPAAEVVHCRPSTLADGSELLVTIEKAEADRSGKAEYAVSVGVRRGDQVVGVIEYLRDEPATSYDETAPIAEWGLPVSVATLTEIVTDPRFGVLTSADMIAKGEALDNFDEAGVSGAEVDSGTAVEVSTSATERPGDAGTTSPR